MASGYTTTTTLTELIPEITQQVGFIYQDKSLGRSLVSVYDISGVPGNVVEIPRFDEVASSTSVAETGTPTSHALDSGDMATLTCARRSVYVGWGDLSRSAANATINDVAEAIGMAFVKAVDASIFGIVTATTNWTTGTGATNAALDMAKLRAGVLLLEKNEVDDDLYGVVHPHQWDQIRATFTPVTVATNSTAITISNDVSNAMIKAGMGNFLGVEWFKSNRIGSGTVTATADVYNGLIFSRRGIGFAFKWMVEQGIETQREASEALTKIVLNWADSAGVAYGSAVCKLYSTSG
jgi:hypothetical protein